MRAGSLVLCTGTGALYMWQDSSADWVNDEEVAECIGIPGSQSRPFNFLNEYMNRQFDRGMIDSKGGFTTADVRWGPNGRSIILQDKEMFTCAFVVED